MKSLLFSFCLLLFLAPAISSEEAKEGKQLTQLFKSLKQALQKAKKDLIQSRRLTEELREELIKLETQLKTQFELSSSLSLSLQESERSVASLELQRNVAIGVGIGALILQGFLKK